MQEVRAAVMVDISRADNVSLTPNLQSPTSHQNPFTSLLLTRNPKKLVWVFQLKLKQSVASHIY